VGRWLLGRDAKNFKAKYGPHDMISGFTSFTGRKNQNSVGNPECNMPDTEIGKKS